MPWTLSRTMAKNPVVICGLPGIGNVGKIAVDFLVDALQAKKVGEYFSHKLPNSVFVNEQNLVELPRIELYHAEAQGRQLLFLVGDVQPIDEEGTYAFCDELLDELQKLHVASIITLAGVGLRNIPKKPKVYITGTSKQAITKYATALKQRAYGIVGPIIGVSGVLVALAGRREMPAVCLLAETYGHPLYLGVTGARELLKTLGAALEIRLKLENLDEEIAELEQDIVQRREIPQTFRGKRRETSYIG